LTLWFRIITLHFLSLYLITPSQLFNKRMRKMENNSFEDYEKEEVTENGEDDNFEQNYDSLTMEEKLDHVDWRVRRS
jgi:hypothetical protein